MIPPPAPPSSARRKITTSSEITYPPRAKLPWAGFVGNRLPAGQTDEGRDAVSFLSVGAAACPDALEFHTQKQGSERPSPWGEGVTPFGVTDVGPIVFRAVQKFAPAPLHTRHGLRRATLCKQERALLRETSPVLLSEGFPSRGRLFLCPGGFCGDLLRSGIATQRARHAAAPTVPCGGFALFLKKSPSATGKIPWPMASKRKR